METGSVQELLVEPHALGGQGGVLAAHAARGGARIGAWSTEYGPLNRVVSLWNAPAGARPGEEAAADDWLHPRALARRLQVRRAVRPELLSAPCLELRMYAAQPGECDSFLAALLQALPFRERYSPCAAVWKSSERDVEIAVHLWAYESLEQRMAARAAAMQDPDWSAYRASIRPLLANLQAWLLLPLAKEIR